MINLISDILKSIHFVGIGLIILVSLTFHFIIKRIIDATIKDESSYEDLMINLTGRYLKGEITKEEYKEMKEKIDSNVE